MMFPYTLFARVQVERSRNPSEESGLSLLFANVLMDNRNAARLREIVREADPDIILAVETDEWWMQQLAEFEQTHPHVVCTSVNTYGMLSLSHRNVDPKSASSFRRHPFDSHARQARVGQW